MRVFLCGGCGHYYETDTPLEVMESEYVSEYGHSQAGSDEDNHSVCDFCYDAIMARKHEAN